MYNENKKHWIELISKKDSGWVEEAKWRKENEYWLHHSFKIALKVLTYMRENNISKEVFAESISMPLDEFNQLVKGSFNMTMKTICDIEKVIGEKLIAL